MFHFAVPFAIAPSSAAPKMTSGLRFGFRKWRGCPTCYLVESSLVDLIQTGAKANATAADRSVRATRAELLGWERTDACAPDVNLDIVDFGWMTHGID